MKTMMIYFLAVLMLSAIALAKNELEKGKIQLENKGIYLFY